MIDYYDLLVTCFQIYSKDFTPIKEKEKPNFPSIWRYKKFFYHAVRKQLGDMCPISIQKITFPKDFTKDIMIEIKQQTLTKLKVRENIKEEEKEFSFPVDNCIILGDFILNFYQNKDQKFRFTFNTFMIKEGVVMLRVKRDQMDLLKDVPDDFYLKIYFESKPPDIKYKSDLEKLFSKSPQYMKDIKKKEQAKPQQSVGFIAELKRRFFGFESQSEQSENSSPPLAPKRKLSNPETPNGKRYDTPKKDTPKKTEEKKEEKKEEIREFREISLEIEKDKIKEELKDTKIEELKEEKKEDMEVLETPSKISEIQNIDVEGKILEFKDSESTPKPPPLNLSSIPPPPQMQGPPKPPNLMLSPPTTLMPQLLGSPRKTPLKSLHWTPISHKEVHEKTLWSNLELDEKKIDSNQIESLFSSKPLVSKQSQKSMMSPRGEPALVNMNRARTIEILLKQYKHLENPQEDIPNIVKDLKVDGLTLEKLNGIIVMSPTQEEYDKISSIKGELTNVDKLVINIGNIPRYKENLKTMQYMLIIKSNSFLINFNYLNYKYEALKEIKNSKKFSKVLQNILVIGNILNSGKRTGNAKGFKLEVLNSLTETKSTDGKISLMDFLVETCKSEEIHTFSEEFKSIEEGTKMSIEELELECNKMKEYFTHFQNECIFNSTNEEIITMKGITEDFYQRFSEDIIKVKSYYQEVLEYFGEKGMKESDFFIIIKNFLKDFKQGKMK